MIGNLLAAATWLALGGGLAWLTWQQRIARRKGAHPSGIFRRSRVPCPTCDRFFWSDLGWNRPGDPHLYCRPTCVPDPTDPPPYGGPR